jgi:RNA polymerase sigma-70 factor (ECF subfamily)
MSDSSFHTTQMDGLLQRIRADDKAAWDELLRHVGGRLERLARKMLRSFPGVHRWAQTDDVLQSSLMRLLRSLKEAHPTSTREFFALAAEQIRRELLDLVRHFFGPEGLGAHHSSVSPDDSKPPPEPADRTESAEDLEKWSAFHEEVAKLPAEEREVVGLIYYHGWTQAQVAKLFHVSARTVRRRWESALVKLYRALKTQGPPE